MATLASVPTTQTPRRGRPPLHRREDIVAAAAEVLIQRGYDSLRYSDVSGAAGIPTASLQHYFPTLDKLRRDALKHRVRSGLASMSAEVAAIVDPWEQVQQIISSSIGSDPARRRTDWVMWMEYWRAAAHDPELALDSSEVGRAWLALAAGCIEAGAASGRFRLVEDTAQEAAHELRAVLAGFGPGLAVEHSQRQAEQVFDLAERAARRILNPSPFDFGAGSRTTRPKKAPAAATASSVKAQPKLVRTLKDVKDAKAAKEARAAKPPTKDKTGVKKAKGSKARKG